jgi:hypothetical protein
MLGWAQCGFHRKCAGTCYAELVFLHLMGSVGHEVHSGVAGAQNVDALFFMLRTARCSFHKKCVSTRYTKLMFLYPVGSSGDIVHSGASMARNVDALFSRSCGFDATSIKSAPGQVMSNLCFCIQCDLRVM